MICYGIQIVFFVGLGIVGWVMMVGMLIRFVMDSLFIEYQRVIVCQSKNGIVMFLVVNGYIGIVIYSDSVYVFGVFNGKVYLKKKFVYLVYFYEYVYCVRIFLIVVIDFRLVGI